jgi:hypothetical protein
VCCAQLVEETLDVFGADAYELCVVTPVSLEVGEVLVLYVATQRVAHDLALGLAGGAGEGLGLSGELVGDRDGKQAGHMKSSYRTRELELGLLGEPVFEHGAGEANVASNAQARVVDDLGMSVTD